MGIYNRTLEMSRRLSFHCYKCGPDVLMRERLLNATELQLTCDVCTVVLLIVTRSAIPKNADDLRGVIRYRAGGRAIDHGRGLRCHNCGALLIAIGKGELGGRIDCRRCRTTHHIGSVTAPPSLPRVLRSGSTGSDSPPATRALSAR
jgi:hypothetical protein